MDEERVDRLAARLRAMLAADLPPDAASSTALAMALLALQAEAGQVTDGEDALLERIELLPAFVERERERRSADDLPALVRRFVRGDPMQPAEQSDPATAVRAARRARLRQLQRDGVDLSLLEAMLAQTPLQRIANMERQLRFVQALQRARREQENER